MAKIRCMIFSDNSGENETVVFVEDEIEMDINDLIEKYRLKDQDYCDSSIMDDMDFPIGFPFDRILKKMTGFSL